MLFSYGSGLAATLFSVRFSENFSAGSPLDKLVTSLSDLQDRLDSRQKVEPATFSSAMKLREETHHLGEYSCHFLPLLTSRRLAAFPVAEMTHSRIRRFVIESQL